MTRSALGIWIMAIGLVVATGAALWKTKHEIERRPTDAWGSDLRVKLLTAEARDNPGHKILDPVKLERGIEEHLPTPEPRSDYPLSALVAEWTSNSASMELAQTRGSVESREDFRNRAVEDFSYFIHKMPPQKE